jgi:hypothetical protein
MRVVHWLGGFVGVVSMLACRGDLATVSSMGGLGSGEPLFGTGTLSSPIPDGMVEVDVRAGGDRLVTELAGVPGLCVGYVAPAQPDYRFELTGSFPALSIGACADTDTALVIRDPSGAIQCVDDTEGTNPVWSGETPQTGTYDVWVATYVQGASAQAKLRITDSEDGVCARVNSDGPPVAPPVALERGFGLHTLVTTAGGPVPANALRGASHCAGNIREDGPTVRLELTGASGRLMVASCSREDTTLAIRTPSGGWLCDDDTESHNPRVQISAATAGTYQIFVGTYSSGSSASTKVNFAESVRVMCTSGAGIWPSTPQK